MTLNTLRGYLSRFRKPRQITIVVHVPEIDSAVLGRSVAQAWAADRAF